MTTPEAIAKVRRAGVALSLTDGRLKYKGPAGAYSDDLRALVNFHRQEIIAHLTQQTRADPVLAEVRALLDRLDRLAVSKPGWPLVVSTYRALAGCWHGERNSKLHELPAALRDLLARWAAESQNVRAP